jgi:hypothetical protein
MFLVVFFFGEVVDTISFLLILFQYFIVPLRTTDKALMNSDQLQVLFDEVPLSSLL